MEFSYAHESDPEMKKTLEQLPADGVKNYVDAQRERLCADLDAIVAARLDSGAEAGETMDFKAKTWDLLC